MARRSSRSWSRYASAAPQGGASVTLLAEGNGRVWAWSCTVVPSAIRPSVLTKQRGQRALPPAATKSGQHLALADALAQEGWQQVTIHSVGISYSGVLHSTFHEMATALHIFAGKLSHSPGRLPSTLLLLTPASSAPEPN